MLGLFMGIFAVVFFLYLWWKWSVDTQLAGLESLKGPKIYPFIGNLLEFLPIRDAMTNLCKICTIYGNTCKVSMPISNAIITADPDFCEHIFTSQDTINKAGCLYQFLKDWLGDGLLLSEIPKWRARRKMITPTFHFKILEQFLQVFNENNIVLIHQLQKAVEKQNRINIVDFVTLAALDNIVKTAMGINLNSQMNDKTDFVWATKFMTANVCDHLVNPLTLFKPIYMLTPMYWKERKALKILKNYTMTLIRSKKQALAQSKNNGDECKDEFGIKKKTAFLDLLLEATVDGKPLTDDDIMEEVDTFLFEGYDTVSTGLSFSLYCIAKHPEIQAKILQEQYQIFGIDPNRECTSEDLKEMVYLEMVIKEVLRLYPSVPMISRNVTSDFQYKDLHVKKNLCIVMLLRQMHLDPEYFPEPTKFIPERFTPEAISKRHSFVYVPFSAGYRNCIGQKFAMMELKSTVSKVCRHFDLGMTSPAHECEIISSVVTHSSNGVYITMKARKWEKS